MCAIRTSCILRVLCYRERTPHFSICDLYSDLIQSRWASRSRLYPPTSTMTNTLNSAIDLEEGAMEQESPKTASDLYSLLGEFTVEFERVCLFMKEAINHWSLLAGNKDEIYVKTLTTGMGAKSLLVAYRSIAVRVRKLSADEQKILTNIYNQIESLILERNDMLHGTWFGPTSSEKYREMVSIEGRKVKHTKNGIADKNLNLSLETFGPLIEQCRKLHLILVAVVLSLKSPKFSSNFEYDSEGLIVLKDGGVKI